MLLKLFSLFTGFGAGILFIRSLPVEKPFNINEFLLDLILHPMQFFIGMVFFIISFLANAYLLKTGMEETYFLLKKKSIEWFDLLLSYSVVIIFYILFVQGFWQTIFLLLFSILYSFLSLNFNVNKDVEVERF